MQPEATLAGAPKVAAANFVIWTGLAAMAVGMFMAILDVKIVATSLPAIQDALGIRPDQMSWVQTAYLVTEVTAIPLTGLLIRILSMRWLFLASTALFTLASIGCASSGTLPALIAWRVLQGFAGGALIPIVFAAAFLMVSPRRQGLATMLASLLIALKEALGRGGVSGLGLLGLVYLRPVFLAFVRGHGSREIGRIMLVTGAAQLLMAPVAVALERRLDARVLTAAGFGLFALGLGLSGLQTPSTDAAERMWPQILRGAAIMFCLLPPTRLALGHLAAERVPDASGPFNLTYNIGGAIGLALIGTAIYGRSSVHATALLARLETGDAATAAMIPQGAAAIDPGAMALLGPLIEKAALTQAVNDAWLMVAVLTLAALLCVPFARRPPVGSVLSHV